jgi:UDP-N-acetylglucosamine/UDP-N-acetylgalactosamine diphosphorylase
MLDQAPIFLGGQGGLVGPARLAFGTVIAAGSICRKDELRPGLLLFDGGLKKGKIPFTAGLYRNVKRTVHNNLIYIGNLMALRQWYMKVRREFVGPNFPDTLLAGLEQVIDRAVDERIGRLEGLSDRMPRSIKLYTAAVGEDDASLLLSQKKELHARWSEIETCFYEVKNAAGDTKLYDSFLRLLEPFAKENGYDYIATIKALDKKTKAIGIKWLSSIVKTTVERVTQYLPSYGILP